jgi:hypoxia up-regulated 1
MTNNLRWFWASALVTLFSLSLVEASVVGIDFGSDTFKVSLVKGKSFDVVLNDASGRKTPSAVALDRGELIYGTDAKNLVYTLRYPFHYKHKLKPIIYDLFC